MARIISEDAATALMSHKTFSRANTQVRRNDDGDYDLYLFDNLIARYTHDKRLFITNAGWNSSTTRERLNAIPNVWTRTVKEQMFLNNTKWDGKWTELIQAGPVLIISSVK
jgi:hypothetical protein